MRLQKFYSMSKKIPASFPDPSLIDHLDPPLSTKLERQQKGISIRAPRVVRSVHSVGRCLCEKSEFRGPRFITFNSKKKPFLGHPATRGEIKKYNKDDPREYFEQCFEKQRKIGEGSFGEVFRVKSKFDGRHYAVKRTIEPFRNCRDKALKLREVQKHELLQHHPNLVDFKCAWEEKGRLYIQTELCDCSLSDYADRVHCIPEEELWGYFADIVAAVHHLHKQDLLHLDIKPENIFISKKKCKLGDFGLVFDQQTDNISTAQDGDSKYLAQEILNNPPDKPADIFSLGISILELASDLDLPSRGNGWHMLREGQIPERFTQGISPKLRRLIFLMMDIDPAKRPTALELYNNSTIQYYLKKRYPVKNSSFLSGWVKSDDSFETEEDETVGEKKNESGDLNDTGNEVDSKRRRKSIVRFAHIEGKTLVEEAQRSPASLHREFLGRHKCGTPANVSCCNCNSAKNSNGGKEANSPEEPADILSSPLSSRFKSGRRSRSSILSGVPLKVRKLNLNLDLSDTEDTKENNPPNGRKIASRGSSADELKC